MPKCVLIIGEDPACIDFSAPDAPKGVTAKSITDGLNGSRDRLIAQGHDAEILLTRGPETVAALTTAALKAKPRDVIVIGAGLRTLPANADEFERLMNVLLQEAPDAKLAFNSKPDDSDVAALRML